MQMKPTSDSKTSNIFPEIVIQTAVNFSLGKICREFACSIRSLNCSGFRKCHCSIKVVCKGFSELY